MNAQFIPVDPFDYIVFGGTGDLAERKLLPALYHRQVDGQITEPTRIIGVSRSELTDKQYRAFAHKALQDFVKEPLDDEQVKNFLARGKSGFFVID